MNKVLTTSNNNEVIDENTFAFLEQMLLNVEVSERKYVIKDVRIALFKRQISTR